MWLHTFDSSAPLNGTITACGSLASIHSLILDNLKEKGDKGKERVVERGRGKENTYNNYVAMQQSQHKSKANVNNYICACVLRMLKTSGRFEECSVRGKKWCVCVRVMADHLFFLRM